jgi:hypothetical protein
MRKTHTRRLSVQKIILATKTRHGEWCCGVVLGQGVRLALGTHI